MNGQTNNPNTVIKGKLFWADGGIAEAIPASNTGLIQLVTPADYAVALMRMGYSSDADFTFNIRLSTSGGLLFDNPIHNQAFFGDMAQGCPPAVLYVPRVLPRSTPLIIEINNLDTLNPNTVYFGLMGAKLRYN